MPVMRRSDFVRRAIDVIEIMQPSNDLPLVHKGTALNQRFKMSAARCINTAGVFRRIDKNLLLAPKRLIVGKCAFKLTMQHGCIQNAAPGEGYAIVKNGLTPAQFRPNGDLPQVMGMSNQHAGRFPLEKLDKPGAEAPGRCFE